MIREGVDIRPFGLALKEQKGAPMKNLSSFKS
jgi:hypothetical protein